MADTLGQLKWIIDVDTATGEAKLRAFNEKVKGTAGETEKSSDRSNKAFNSIAKVGIAGAIAAVAAFGVAVAKNVGNAVKRFDTLNNAPKVLQNLGFSADESKKAIDSIDQGIRGLPTSLDSAASALTSIASASGLSAKEATDLTLAFNNMALAGGKGPAEAERALTQYTQALGRGKFGMQDFNTLAEVMPAQLNQVAKTLLGPEANVRQLGTALSTGKLDIKDFNDTIVELNQKGGKNFASFDKQAKDATAGIGTGFSNMNIAITRGITKIFQAIGKENITNALSAIGKALETVLGGIASTVSFIAKYKDIFAPIAVAITAIVTAATAWWSILKLVSLAQAAFNIILAANPIGLIIIAIAGLVAGLTYFFTQTETGKKIFQGFLDFMKGVFDGIGKAISFVWEWVKKNWPLLLAILTGPIGIAIGLIIQNFDKVKAFIGAVWNGIKTGASNAWNGIKNAFSAVGSFFTTIFRNAWNGVKTIWNAVGGFFRGIWGKIKGAFDGVKNLGRNIVEGLWNGISDMAGWIGNKIKGFGDGVLKGIKNFFGIKSPSRVMRDQVGKMLGFGVAEGITQSTTSAVKAAQKASGDVLNAFKTQTSTFDATARLNTVDSASSMVSSNNFGENNASTAGNGAVINQTNNFYDSDEPNMEKVNQDLKWELNKL